MPWNTEINLLKNFIPVLYLGIFIPNLSLASSLDCPKQSKTSFCAVELSDLHEKWQDYNFTAYLISDAPLKLLDDTHQLWFTRLQQCKSLNCSRQLFESRLNDLNLYTSLNQTLTQHYLKFEQGKMAKNPVHLKIHQLNKNNIKIEGTAYRNPNNHLDKQSFAFLAYTTPDEKNLIINNETDCKYNFHYQKSLLKVSSLQKGCERFVGIYRLYD